LKGANYRAAMDSETLRAAFQPTANQRGQAAFFQPGGLSQLGHLVQPFQLNSGSSRPKWPYAAVLL